MEKKLTGAEMIAQERKEQIEKHGYALQWDKGYRNGELLRAADYCLNPRDGVWPVMWSSFPKYRILKKARIGQLACAGAFYMAENDRIGENRYQSEIDEIAAEIDRLNNHH